MSYSTCDLIDDLYQELDASQVPSPEEGDPADDLLTLMQWARIAIAQRDDLHKLLTEVRDFWRGGDAPAELMERIEKATAVAS